MGHAGGGNADVYEMEDKGPGAVKSKYVGTGADQKDMSQLGKIQELRVGVLQRRRFLAIADMTIVTLFSATSGSSAPSDWVAPLLLLGRS